MEKLEALTSGDAAPPLYRRAELALRKEIQTGRWRPGDCIPTEKELAQTFDVSQGTMRLAIMELVKAGVLYRKQGRGTFVTGLRLDHSIERFFRYGLHEAGVSILPETRLLGADLVKADEQVAEALRLQPGSKVGWLRRLRHYSGEPFVYHDCYFALPLWRRMAGCDFNVANLYEHLQERCDICIVSADEYLTPSLASAEDAKVLGAKPGSPVVHLERHSYGFGRKKIEFRRSVGRGDRFSYHVKL